MISPPPGEDLVGVHIVVRATTDTDDPGTSDAATISRFSASGQDRCRRRSGRLVPITELVDTFPHPAAVENRSVVHPPDLRKAAPGGGIQTNPGPAVPNPRIRVWSTVVSRRRVQPCTAHQSPRAVNGERTHLLQPWKPDMRITFAHLSTDVQTLVRQPKAAISNERPPLGRRAKTSVE